MKPATINTLKALVRRLKVEALHAGRYPTPVSADKWESRDKSKAFTCIAYREGVRNINALNDAISTLEELNR